MIKEHRKDTEEDAEGRLLAFLARVAPLGARPQPDKCASPKEWKTLAN